MKLISKCVLAATTMLAATLPAWSAGPAIVIALNGKPVSSIPVDKLGELTMTVSTGGQSFKQVYSGQWSGLDQALSMKAKRFTRGAATPSVDSARSWENLDLAVTSSDSNWAGKNTLTANMSKGAPELSLYEASTAEDVVFTSLFYRKVYTGKNIWKDGGWVQETRWETVGPALGQATLKLDPPTFASSLDPSKLFSASVEKFNKVDDHGDSEARMMSRTLLYPESYGGRTVNFEGSTVTNVSKADGAVAYNWNYNEDDNSQYVQASFPAKLKLHAVITTTFENVPLPMKTEADFECDKVEGKATHPVGGGNWQGDGLSYKDDIRSHCKTADGKTPDDIVKGINPMGNAKTPQDLMKQFGF